MSMQGTEKQKALSVIVTLLILGAICFYPVKCALSLSNALTKPLTAEQRQELDTLRQNTHDQRNAQRVITQEEYAKVELGMTREQVILIVGDAGNLESSNNAGSLYSFKNFDGLGATMIFDSQGKLVEKNQMKFR